MKKEKNNIYILILCGLLIVAALLLSIYFIQNNKEKDEEIAYTQLLKDIDEENLYEAYINLINNCKIDIFVSGILDKSRKNRDDCWKSIFKGNI